MPANIANSSRSGVLRRLRQLGPTFKRNLLLPNANAFRLDTVNALKLNPPNGDPSRKHVADYIAISVVLHMADAWTYLSQAYSAAISGDHDIAVHLGYYSELRACMSILASQGIGVFSSAHYLVTNNGSIQPVQPTNQQGGVANFGTHKFCWEAFQEWVAHGGWSPICSALRLGGVTLDDWLSQLPAAGPAVPQLGANAILALGIDIAGLGNDQNLRNEASYRPTALRYLRSLSPSEEVARCANATEVMVSGGSFADGLLSRAVLARLAGDIFHAGTGQTPTADAAGFQLQIQTMVGNVAHSAGPNVAHELVNLATTPPQLLKDAFGTLPVTAAGHHAQVLARAIVLSFLASAFARELLRDAGLSADDIAFWINGFAKDRGVYDGGLPDPPNDLWTDLQDAIQDARNKVVAADPPQSSVHQIDEGCISSLCRFERIAVLGLAT